MAKIIKPIDKDTLAHNQAYFEKFGNEACDQNKKVVLAISEGRDGELLLTTITGLSPQQAHSRLQHIADLLKNQIKAIAN